MELSRICTPEISESSNCCQNHPPPASEFLLGGIDNSPSKNSSEIEIPPSKDNPSKKRRNWGEGNGTIHWRTITRGEKDYPQAYYHWQEKGRKKTKYIPKHLLGDIQEAEFKKRPIIEILTLLGVVPSPSKNTLLGDIENSPSNDVEQSEILPSKNSPSNDVEQSEIPLSKDNPSNDVEQSEIHLSKDNPSNDVEQSEIHLSKDNPSKTRRHKGLGSGSIQWKTITLHGKDYPQAWYHYEFWKDGDRLVKKCKYIPKRLLDRIQKLEVDKAPVRDILSILQVKL
ncbi:hypothetical protein Cylst_6282 (plasmid) [Cylindrospermum stagnale PCC 7417]|uniref:Uncharacterized protein n=1 Tax=Cylindrospermum stagnale PCC 7417 TaxID=56107 RepID=K9X8T6_9NOST|nr:hypothetical protein [Cylindrospermum stagnale]AFZ28519.1 hypothetical protein Cylst_6282 [Cylindrospermum stagnale PCC 7417]